MCANVGVAHDVWTCTDGAGMEIGICAKVGGIDVWKNANNRVSVDRYLEMCSNIDVSVDIGEDVEKQIIADMTRGVDMVIGAEIGIQCNLWTGC